MPIIQQVQCTEIKKMKWNLTQVVFDQVVLNLVITNYQLKIKEGKNNLYRDLNQLKLVFEGVNGSIIVKLL